MAACAILGPLPAQAIVVRDDRDDKLYVDLARQFPATVTFKDRNPPAMAGAGTLITSRWILTAAHVATDLSTQSIVEIAGTEYRLDKIVIHPRWHTNADLTVDIALVHLDGPVTGVKPARPYTKMDETGMVVTFVGRGTTGTGLTGEGGRKWDGLLRAATNRVEKAQGPDLQFRFDAPGDAGVTNLEGISGMADSGGPAYIDRDGELYVIGVSSWQDAKPTNRQEGRYGVLEHYSRVSHFADWIRGVIGEE